MPATEFTPNSPVSYGCGICGRKHAADMACPYEHRGATLDPGGLLHGETPYRPWAHLVASDVDLSYVESSPDNIIPVQTSA